jgi:glutamate racemase
MTKPVLLFDSGIGGLSVLKEARTVLPDQQFVYVADDAGFPYGGWTAEALAGRIVQLFETLLPAFDPALCIIACNTASTQVLEELRTRFPVPFVGTVPAIKPAAERTQSGLISVLATPGTVEREYTYDLIRQFAGRCSVTLVGQGELAELAERYVVGEEIDGARVASLISPCFVQDNNRQTDIVVLGCTHYPFLANVFRAEAPWPVDWLDPAEAIAKHARSVLKAQTQAASETFDEADLVYFTSLQASSKMRRLMRGFGLHWVRSLNRT